MRLKRWTLFFSLSLLSFTPLHVQASPNSYCEGKLQAGSIATRIHPELSGKEFLYSGYEITRVSFFPGTVAEIRRPRLWIDHRAHSGLEEPRGEHERYVEAKVRFAAKEFERRPWGNAFIEGRVATGLNHIPDSTYISVFDEKTGATLGTIRLMSHPYGIKNGQVVYSESLIENYFSHSPSGSPISHPETVPGFPGPKIRTAMEDYLGITLERLDPETLKLSRKNPSITYEKIIREVGNFAIDPTLPPLLRDEVWAQLWSLLTQELVGINQFHPELDALVVTYGDEVSKRLYRDPGFVVDPSFGIIHKDEVDWKVMVTPVERIVAYNQRLLEAGRRTLTPDRLAEIRANQPLLTTAPAAQISYGFLQRKDRIYEDFLKPNSSEDLRTASFALEMKLKRMMDLFEAGKTQYQEESIDILEVIQFGLESPSESIQSASIELLFQFSLLPPFREFLKGEECAAYLKKLLQREQTMDYVNKSYREQGARLHDIYDLLSGMELSSALSFDELWSLMQFAFKGPIGDNRVASTASETLGETLFNTFADGTRKADADRILAKLEPFLSGMPERPYLRRWSPLEDYGDPVETRVRKNLLGWYVDIFGDLPPSYSQKRWLPREYSHFWNRKARRNGSYKTFDLFTAHF